MYTSYQNTPDLFSLLINLLLKLINRHSRVGCDAVVLGWFLDPLLDIDSLVCDGWINDLYIPSISKTLSNEKYMELGGKGLLTLLDDGLHGLMQMMMNMLVHHSWFLRRALKLLFIYRILISRGVILSLGLCRAIIVVDTAFLGIVRVVVLLGQDLGVFQRLDGGVVVVLVLLFLDIGLLFGLVGFLDVGMFDCRVDLGVNSCVFVCGYIVGGRG